MRQRVALARALAQDADVLLMDEPFGALDAMTRDLLHEVLEGIWRRRQLSIVFVTHEVREAVRLGDRVVLLSSRPGRVIGEFEVGFDRPRGMDSAGDRRAGHQDQGPAAGGDHPPWPLRPPGNQRPRWPGWTGWIRPRRSRPGGTGARIWAAAWPKLLALGSALAIWELVYLSGFKHDDPARPGTTIPTCGTSCTTRCSGRRIGTTLRSVVIGFALALVIGTVLGALVSRIRPLRAGFGSLITALQTLPRSSGCRSPSSCSARTRPRSCSSIVVTATPSIANGLIAGADYVPPLLLRAGKTMGLRRLALYRYVILPATLPAFVGGLKQGWAFGWHGLIAAEIVVIILGQPSLGMLLNNDQDQADMARAIAIIIVILIIGIAVDLLFNVVNGRIRRRWGVLRPTATPRLAGRSWPGGDAAARWSAASGSGRDPLRAGVHVHGLAAQEADQRHA